MAKEKVNYQEVYDLYQLCSETKDLREFCADYGVNYDKFMNWQRHQLWSEKLGKTVQVEQPKVAKVRITGKPCNSLRSRMWSGLAALNVSSSCAAVTATTCSRSSSGS